MTINFTKIKIKPFSATTLLLLVDISPAWPELWAWLELSCP